ncbi:MAG: hypothetical protein RL386_1587 [Bacteroidota bacterium]|jgi:hypothetical protein
MDQEKYFADRVDDQINWLNDKAGKYQARYKRLRVLQLLCSASIPFLVATISENTGPLKWIVGGLGVIVTVAEGLQALYKYHELWLQYRATCEALKREKMLFLTGSGRYQGLDNAFAVFVAEVESLLSSENTQWKTYMREADKPAKSN